MWDFIMTVFQTLKTNSQNQITGKSNYTVSSLEFLILLQIIIDWTCSQFAQISIYTWNSHNMSLEMDRNDPTKAPTEPQNEPYLCRVMCLFWFGFQNGTHDWLDCRTLKVANLSFYSSSLVSWKWGCFNIYYWAYW